jgi:folate-dependent phosphoribosylglycinamide formyltransferase PurN
VNKLLVVGNDKIGRKLISKIGKRKDVMIRLDASSDLKRLLKLIGRGSIQIRVLIKMGFAEILRKDYTVESFDRIYNNADLLKAIRAFHIERVYLFRAGLIISKQVLRSRAEILNVHCASIPDYGGLGSIAKALHDHAYDQEATLHRVTEKIDEGEVIATVPYKLDKNILYRKNEDMAYDAGIQLMINELSKLAGEE